MKLKRFDFWLLLALNAVFLLVGQAAAIILGRIYYDKGGNSKWLATLVQTAGFPILFIPYFLIPSPKERSDSSNRPPPPPSIIKVTVIYFFLGALIAGDNMLYSIALLYLSASTYSLICATQLVFNAIFSFFINSQKFTSLIFNSVIALTLSAALLAINEDSDKPPGVTSWKYILGIIAATVASALYSLTLSLMQLSFQKVIKKETFSVVLEMQIYTSVVATGISVIGLFASGEWRTLSGEMQAFTTGKGAYVQILHALVGRYSHCFGDHPARHDEWGQDNRLANSNVGSKNVEKILSSIGAHLTKKTSALNIVFLLAGQGGGIILGRIYYDNGGKSKWMSTLVQSAGFPVLLIPYFLIPLPKQHSDSSNQTPPPMIKVTIIYFLLGALTAGENMLYSVALLYLSASTYSLICATQLAFNAVFSFFINGQKFTTLIFNSVIALTLAASLLAINEDSDKPSGVTRWKYMFGIIIATADSALYSLILSLMQLSFQKVIKKETFHVVLEMQIFVSVVAASISTIGLFANNEGYSNGRHPNAGFATGKAAYVLVLVWTAVGWQVCAVGVVGLIFVVSSLFSNVISTLSLAVTPIASVIILHDKMNGVKMIALLMAIWGFGNYIYQNYLDDLKARRTHFASTHTPNVSSC
nr:probable purine permease 11 isoform X3 [Ipomoea batatas]